MATEAHIRLPEELSAQVQAAAETEGTSVDELTREALQQHLARRAFERLSRRADQSRGNLTDEQVEEHVNRAIQEHRNETRG